MIGAFESNTTVEYIRGVKNHCWQRFDAKSFPRNYRNHRVGATLVVAQIMRLSN